MCRCGDYDIIYSMEIDLIADIATKINRPLAKKVIGSANIIFEYDWAKFSRVTFTEKLAELSPSAREAVSLKFAQIAALSKTPNNKAVMLSYLDEMGLVPAELANEIGGYSTTKVAAVCVAVLDEYAIRSLTGRFFVNIRHGNDVKNFEVEIEDDVAETAVKDHQDQLVEKLKKYVADNEHCAENCEASVFSVEARQIIVLKLTDHPDQVESWDAESNAFDYKDIIPSMKLAVSLDAKSGRVSVHYRDMSVARMILEIFCDEVLGKNHYNISGEVKYDLDKFAKESKARLGDTPSVGGRLPLVRNITVVELYVWLGGSKKSRRTYFEDGSDIYEAIRRERAMMASETVVAGDLAQSVFPVGTLVKRARLLIEYDAPRRPKAHRIIDLMPNTDNGLGDMPRDASDALRKFLEDREVLIKRDVANDGNDRGQNR